MDAISQSGFTGECTGLSGAERAWWVCRMYATQNRPIFIILPDKRSADRFLEDLALFPHIPPDNLFIFPADALLPFRPR